MPRCNGRPLIRRRQLPELPDAHRNHQPRRQLADSRWRHRGHRRRTGANAISGRPGTTTTSTWSSSGKSRPAPTPGIKYLIQASATDDLRDEQGKFLHETSLGFEFQLVDDASPAGTDNPTHASGALYNFLPPTELAAHAAGQWNTGRLRVLGRHVDHWINSRHVLAYDLDSPELKAALAAKSFNSARLMERLAHRRTAIAFQHHHSVAAYRGIRIERLAPVKS